MPTVPRYDQPQVRTENLPNARFRAANVAMPQFQALSNVGQSVGQIGNVIGKIAEREAEAAAQTALIDAQGKYLEAEKKHLYDQQQGALFRQGESAINPTGDGKQSLGKLTEQGLLESSYDIIKNMSPAVRQAFEKWQAGRLASTSEMVERHVFSETKKLEDAKFSATLSNLYDQFAANPYNQQASATNMQALEQLIAQRAIQKGYADGSEEYKNLRADVLSKAHTTVVNRMVIDNPLKAKEYYTENYKMFSAEDRAGVERVVGPLASQQLGYNKAIEILDANPDAPIDQLMMKLRKDPELKSDIRAIKSAETEMKAMHAERKAALQTARDEAAKPVYQILAQVQLAGRTPKMSDIPRDVWANLIKNNPQEADKIQDEIRREQEHQVDRAKARSTEAKLDQLMTWAKLQQSPQGLARTNLDPLLVQGKITPQQYKDLVEEQKKMASQPEFKLQSNIEMAKDVLARFKITEKKEPELYYQNLEALSNYGKQYKAQYGKEPDQKTLDLFLKKRFETKVEEEGRLFNSSEPLGKVKPEKIVVPQQYVAPIDKALKANGLPATQENRRKYYYQYLNQQGAQ